VCVAEDHTGLFMGDQPDMEAEGEYRGSVGVDRLVGGL